MNKRTFNFVCELPAWACGKETMYAASDETMIIMHPNHPPHYFNFTIKKWLPLKPVKSKEVSDDIKSIQRPN